MFRTFAAAVLLALTSGAASAATLTVVGASCDSNFALPSNLTADQGVGAIVSCPTLANRQDATAVNLGAADGNFYSLGLGGAIVFQITPAFTSPVSLVEITNPNSTHREAARVYGSIDGIVFTALGIVSNVVGNSAPLGLTATLTFTGTYNFLALADISRTFFRSTGSLDGFDLDAITVTQAPAPVPLPAAGLLLLGGLGALGLLRRRQMAA